MYLIVDFRSMSGKLSGNPELRSASSTSGSNSRITVSISGMFLLYANCAPDLSSPSCNALTLSIHASSFAAPSLLSGLSMRPTTALALPPAPPAPPSPPKPPPMVLRNFNDSDAGSLCSGPGSSRTLTPKPSSSPSGRGTLMNSSTSPTAGT